MSAANCHEIARMLGRPCLHVARDAGDDAVQQLRDFVGLHRIRVLNIAGARESKEPGIGAWVGEKSVQEVSKMAFVGDDVPVTSR